MTDIFKRKKQTEDTEVVQLKKELENCRFLIHRNEMHFNMAWEENQIAAQIYEREALRCQYNYLIKRLKEKDENLNITKKTEIKIGE